MSRAKNCLNLVMFFYDHESLLVKRDLMLSCKFNRTSLLASKPCMFHWPAGNPAHFGSGSCKALYHSADALVDGFQKSISARKIVLWVFIMFHRCNVLAVSC